MNPISQIELKAHHADLHRQVAVARLSQHAALEWLAKLWGKCAAFRLARLNAATSRV
jgi:hypothetical protein